MSAGREGGRDKESVPSSHNERQDVDGDDVYDKDIAPPGSYHVEVGEGRQSRPEHGARVHSLDLRKGGREGRGEGGKEGGREGGVS